MLSHIPNSNLHLNTGLNITRLVLFKWSYCVFPIIVTNFRSSPMIVVYHTERHSNCCTAQWDWYVPSANWLFKCCKNPCTSIFFSDHNLWFDQKNYWFNTQIYVYTCKSNFHTMGCTQSRTNLVSGRQGTQLQIFQVFLTLEPV